MTKKEPIFSAVVGNAVTLGFFDIYPDLTCIWQYGKQKETWTVSIGTLETYLDIAREEGRKYIRGAFVQEYCWNPKALNDQEAA